MSATGDPVTARTGTPPEDDAPARTSVARNATLLTVATVVARVAAFGLAVVMGRVLGPETYGRYGFAAAIVTVVIPIADLGLTPYIIREVARHGTDARRTVVACVRAKVLSSVATLLLGLGAIALASPEPELALALALLLVAFLADGAAQFAFGFFQGRETMGFQALITTTTSLGRSVGGIVLVLVTGSLGVVLAWIALTSLWQLGRAGIRMTQVLRAETAPAGDPAGDRPAIEWSSVVAMGLITVFAMVYLRADSVILGSAAGEDDVGWYTAAYTLMSGLQIVPWMVATALTPVYARTWASDRAAFDRAWTDGCRGVLLLALPLALVVCLLAGPIVGRLFGDEFDPAATALAILVWSTPVWSLNMVVSGVLRGAGRERAMTVATGVGAALNVGANLWAIPRYGIEGAATATVATEAVVLLALLAVAMMRGIVSWPDLPYLGLAASLAALGAVAVALDGLPVELALSAALTAYAVVLLLTRSVRREEVAGLSRAVRR